MIYITGDCHQDFERFNMKNFPEQRELTRDDHVIICGDFGGVWNKNEEKKKRCWTGLTIRTLPHYLWMETMKILTGCMNIQKRNGTAAEFTRSVHLLCI